MDDVMWRTDAGDPGDRTIPKSKLYLLPGAFIYQKPPYIVYITQSPGCLPYSFFEFRAGKKNGVTECVSQPVRVLLQAW